MPSLLYAVRNFDFAALLLYLSRGLAPYAAYPFAVRNFDFAALLLYLSRGLAPYAKSKESPAKNVNTFRRGFFRFVARLVAITKVLVFLCITDSMFLLV